MSFDREKFIELLLKIQVTGERLDRGAYIFILWMRMRYIRLRVFARQYQAPIAGLAFIAGCVIEAQTFTSGIFDTDVSMTVLTCIGAALVIAPLCYFVCRVVDAGTHPLEGIRGVSGN